MVSKSDPLRLEVEDLPELCTVEEYGGVTRQGLTKAYEDVRLKRIDSIRLGRTIRIPRRAIEELVYGKAEPVRLRAVK